MDRVRIYANSHYVTPKPTMKQAMGGIRAELKLRLDQLVGEGKLLEAQRLEQRTTFDLEMLEATGVCNGIENYSRYLTGPRSGRAAPHLVRIHPRQRHRLRRRIPRLGPADRARCTKGTTAASSPWPSTASACPLAWTTAPSSSRSGTPCARNRSTSPRPPPPAELDQTGGVFAEQVIRPTGLLDPVGRDPPRRPRRSTTCWTRSASVTQRGLCARSVTTLTKRMAEDLTEYLHEQGIKVRYMHSDIDTIERIEILRDLRLGAFDVLVGINLLREGLDIPECGLVAILDADKEGFLRSETSLVQTIGRAARNADGRVIMYADSITGSMERALRETDRRRAKQMAYNEAHGITPTTIRKNVDDVLAGLYPADTDQSRVTAKIDKPMVGANLQAHLDGLRDEDAQGRREPRVRGGRSPARRGQAPRGRRPRRRRRPHGAPVRRRPGGRGRPQGRGPQHRGAWGDARGER